MYLRYKSPELELLHIEEQFLLSLSSGATIEDFVNDNDNDGIDGWI